MEAIPAAGWQIIQDAENSLKVLVCQPRIEYSEALWVAKLRAVLVREKVQPDLAVEYVDNLQLTETGKAILIKSLVDNFFD